MAIKSVVKEESIESIPNQQIIIKDEFIYPFDSTESNQQLGSKLFWCTIKVAKH